VTAKAHKGDPFDALGNSHRRSIVELLAGRPRSVQEIADRLPISRPAVSRHLRLLNRAGLVSDEQVGTRRLYRLDEKGAEAARQYLSEVWGQVGTRFRLFAENTRPPSTRR
jgi:DNA-binding transcriptional ArsR family regulator